MLKKYLLILFVLFANFNTAWAAAPTAYHQKLIGSYGIQAMPRSTTLLAQLATASMSADEVASYDGFPFLVTHYYLRPEFEHHLPSSQRSKASLPKQQILFRALHLNTPNTWLLQDSSPQDFVSLNATDGRDLSQVEPSSAQLNTLSLINHALTPYRLNLLGLPHLQTVLHRNLRFHPVSGTLSC